MNAAIPNHKLHPPNALKNIQRIAGAIGFILISQVANSPWAVAQQGFTQPYKVVQLATTEYGIVSKIVVRKGEQIKAGSAVASLNCSVLNATLRIAQQKAKATGKRMAAEATLQDKEQHYQQLSKLLASSHANQKEVRLAKLAQEIAQANLQSLHDEQLAFQLDVEKIKLQIDRRTIRSPIDATVLDVFQEVGESVSASENRIATLVDLSRLRVEFFLDSKDSIDYHSGQKLPVYFPATHQRCDAVVEYVSPVTDSKSNTVKLELILDNKTNQFRSGVRCLLDTRRMASLK